MNDQPPVVAVSLPDRPSSDKAFDKFVGIDSAIDLLKEFAEEANGDLEVYRANNMKIDRAVLLSGPSGVGKTEIIKALAEALHAELDLVDLGDIHGTHVGEWARGVEDTFKSAMSSGKRVLVAFDEMDGLVRSGNPDVTANITVVLKTMLERIQTEGDVFFIGATNNPDKIDPVVRNVKRIPLQIYIPGIDQDRRQDLFRKFLYPSSAAADLDKEIAALGVLDALDYQFFEYAFSTEDFSPGEIEQVVILAKRKAFRRNKDKSQTVYPTHDDIVRAIDEIKKSRS